MSKASRNRDIARARVAQMRAEQASRARRRQNLTWAGALVLAAVAAVGIALAVSGGGGKAGASGGTGSSPAATGSTGGTRTGGPGGTSTPVLKLGPISSLGALQPAPRSGPDGFEGVPIPAAPSLGGRAAAAAGAAVDGIRCQSSEQSLFHIHAHLTIFVNGSQRQVPAGIGIPGSTTQTSAQGPVAAGGSCLYWLHTHAPDGIIHVESPVHRTFTLGDFFDEWGQPLGPSRLGPVPGRVIAIYNGKVYQGNPRDIPLDAHAQIQLEVGKPLITQQAITFPPGL